MPSTRPSGATTFRLHVGRSMSLRYLATQRNLRGPNLVVCPLSVLGTWTAQVAQWCPFLHVIRLHGTEKVCAPNKGTGWAVRSASGPLAWVLGGAGLAGDRVPAPPQRMPRGGTSGWGHMGMRMGMRMGMGVGMGMGQACHECTPHPALS